MDRCDLLSSSRSGRWGESQSASKAGQAAQGRVDPCFPTVSQRVLGTAMRDTFPNHNLGGNLGNFLISFMVPIEVPIHKYFSEPQNYNPVIRVPNLI